MHVSLCYTDTDSSLSSEDELETSWGQKNGSYVEEPPERKTFPTLVQVCHVCGDRVGGEGGGGEVPYVGYPELF